MTILLLLGLAHLPILRIMTLAAYPAAFAFLFALSQAAEEDGIGPC